MKSQSAAAFGAGELRKLLAAGSGGGIAADYRVLAEGCGLAVPRAAGWLQAEGEDRQRYLQGMVTCDLESLSGEVADGSAVGRGAYGFVTDVKGRIQADVVVSDLEERLLLEVAAEAEEAVVDHLKRYIVADRVEVGKRGPTLALLVAGPLAGETVAGALEPGREADLCAVPRTSWDHVLLDWRGARLLARRERRYGLDAWVLLGAPDVDWRRLVARLETAGARPVGSEALEVARVERGVPRFGVDFDTTHLPQETGIENWAVSYTKGCYLGQEVVARLHYLGKPKRILRGLLLDRVTPPGSRLANADGGEVGTLTSAVDSIALGRPLGLAVVKRQASEPGTSLALDSDGKAEVVALPFAGAS